MCYCLGHANTVTPEDIANSVTTTLMGGYANDFDIDGIVSDIISTYGLVDITTMPIPEYWAIVQNHEVKA